MVEIRRSGQTQIKFEGALIRFDRMIVGFEGKEELSMIFRFLVDYQDRED